MAKIKIYYPTSGSIEIRCENAKVKKTLNKEDYVSCRVLSESVLSIPIGSYIQSFTTANGLATTYKLNKQPKVVELAEDLFQYDFVFESQMYDLKKSTLKILGETDTGYIGNAESYLDLIISSLLADGYTFTKGTVDSTDDKALQFVGENCWAALNRICTDFDLEFIFIGNEISLQSRISNDRSSILLSQGYGDGIVKIDKVESNDKNMVTRLYYQGSTKNRPIGGTKRLHGSANYASNNESTYGVYSAVKYYDDIYPTYTGTIGTIEYINEDATPTFIDLGTSFDLNTYVIPGTLPQIQMIDGDCAGYAFEVYRYDHDIKKFFLKPQNDAAGNQIPSVSGLNIAPGDTFNIVNMSLPGEYETAAIAALDAAASADILEMSNPPVDFNIELDPAFINDIYEGGEQVFDVGDKLGITDPFLNIPSNQRITTIEYDLFYKPDCKITISEARFDLAGRQEEIDNYLSSKSIYKNELYKPVIINKTYRTTDDVWNQVFNNQDDTFDFDGKSRTKSLDPYALSLDSGEIQFSVKNVEIKTNLNDLPNSIGVTSGKIIHHSYNAKRRYEISKDLAGLGYDSTREWTVNATTITAPDSAKSYNVFARLPLTDGATEATLFLDENHVYAKSVDDFIIYKLGYITETVKGKRKSSMLWGSSSGDYVDIDLYSGGKTGWDYDYIHNVIISFDELTRTFSIAPVGSEFYYYISAEKYIFDSEQTVTISNTEGTWFIYFNGNTLVSSQIPWSIAANNVAMVATLYWDATNSEMVGDIQPELHSWVLDPATHEIFHDTVGARYDNFDGGLSLSLNGTDKIDITGGIIRDEDITIHIEDSATPSDYWEQILTPWTGRKLYRDGASGLWRDTTLSDTPVILSTNILQYNEYTGTAYTLSNVTTNRYCAYWIIATGHITSPIIAIPGQQTNTILADAIDQNTIDSMNFGALPTPEHKVIYRIIVQSKISAPYYEIVDTKDYRTTGDMGSNVPIVSAHGALSGLLSDDHPQYFHLSQDETVLGENTFSNDNHFTANLYANNVIFGLTPTLSGVAGEMFWNEIEKTVSITLEDGGSWELGQELGDYYTNLSGATLVNGDVVSVVGATGNRPAVSLTDVSNHDSAHACIGMVTVPTINNNAVGRVTKKGKVRGLNTSSFAEGAEVFVNPAAPGKLTTTEPSAPNFYISVGVVAVSHATEGVIDLNIRIHPKVISLSDVNGTPLTTNGQLMVWDNDNVYFDFTHNINDYLLVADEHPALSLISEDVTMLSLDEANQILTYNVPTLDQVTTAGYTTNNSIIINGLQVNGSSSFNGDSFFYSEVTRDTDATLGDHIPRWSQITGADWYVITSTDIANWNNGIPYGGNDNQIFVSNGVGGGDWETHWVLTIPDSNSQYYTLSDSFDYGSAVFTFDTNAGTRGLGLEMTSDYDTYIKLISGSYYNQIQTIGSNFQIKAYSGLASTAAMTISNSDATLGNVSFGHSVDIYELTLGSVNTYTFPIADGAANKILVTDGAGTLSWQDWYYYTFNPDFFTVDGSNVVSNKIWTKGTEGYYSSYQFAFGDVTDTHPNSQVWIHPNNDADFPLLVTTKHQTGIQIYRESNDGVFSSKRALFEIWNSTTDDQNPLIYLNNQSAAQSNLIETDGNVFTLYSDGRVKGAEAVNDDEFVTKSQLSTGGSLLQNLNSVLDEGNTSYFAIELGNYIQATTGKFTNLSTGYLPYHVDDATGLDNSILYTDGSILAINAPSNLSVGKFIIGLDGPDNGVTIWSESGWTTSRFWNDDTYGHLRLTKGSGNTSGISITDQENNLLIGYADNYSAAYKLQVNGDVYADGAQVLTGGLIASGLLIERDTYVVPTFTSHDNVNAWGGSFITARRSRGTASAPLAVQTGDVIGYLDFWGYDGSGYTRAGQISSSVKSGTTTGFIPVKFTFSDAGWGSMLTIDSNLSSFTMPLTHSSAGGDGTKSALLSDVQSEIDTYLNYSGLTSSKIPYWNGSNLVDSAFYSDGTNVSIGVNSFTRLLRVNGVQGWSTGSYEIAYLNPLSTGADFALKNGTGSSKIRLDARSTGNSYINQGMFYVGFDTNQTGDILQVNGSSYFAGDGTFSGKITAGADATASEDVPRWGQITALPAYSITSTEIDNWNSKRLFETSLYTGATLPNDSAIISGVTYVYDSLIDYTGSWGHGLTMKSTLNRVVQISIPDTDILNFAIRQQSDHTSGTTWGNWSRIAHTANQGLFDVSLFDWSNVSVADIPDFTDNSTNWNTAYGWGDWSTGVNQAFIESNLIGDISTHTHAQYLELADLAQYVKSDGTNGERFVFGDNSRATTRENVSIQTINKSGFYYTGGSTTGTPTSNNYNLIHVAADYTDGYGLQIAAMNSSSQELYFRTEFSSDGSWAAWREIYHTGNFDQTVIESNLTGNITTHTHSYDNYQNWVLWENGVDRGTVDSLSAVEFANGDNVNISFSTVSFRKQVEINVTGVALSGHTHTTTDITNLSSYTGFDSRYYTETEVDGLLSGKSDIGHTHSYDNYGNWSVRDDSSVLQTVTSGFVLDVLGGSGITTAISGGNLTISVTPLSFDYYESWTVAGDTGGFSVETQDTLSIVGGTNVTTSVAGATLTINATGGTSPWTTSGSDIYYSGGNVGFGGAPAAGYNLYNEYTSGRFFGVSSSGLEVYTCNITELKNSSGTLVDSSANADFLSLSINASTRINSSGYFLPVSSNEVSAPNNSIFYSTVQSKLVYKDPSGVSHALY